MGTKVAPLYTPTPTQHNTHTISIMDGRDHLTFGLGNRKHLWNASSIATLLSPHLSSPLQTLSDVSFSREVAWILHTAMRWGCSSEVPVESQQNGWSKRAERLQVLGESTEEGWPQSPERRLRAGCESQASGLQKHFRQIDSGI